uniref:hypothetical protein n=1 Tax=Thiohalomonas denitrificans TaxID=415747 RepID=UPI0026E9DF7B
AGDYFVAGAPRNDSGGEVLQEEPQRRGNLDVAEYQTASSLGLLAVTETEVLQEEPQRRGNLGVRSRDYFVAGAPRNDSGGKFFRRSLSDAAIWGFWEREITSSLRLGFGILENRFQTFSITAFHGGMRRSTTYIHVGVLAMTAERSSLIQGVAAGRARNST